MICFNGKILEESHFKINYNNRYFLYGDGFFETIKILKGKPVFWDDHYFRIMGSLCMLRMNIPSYFNSEYLYNNIQKLLDVNKSCSDSSRIRILFYRDSDGFYLPDTQSFSFIISVKPLDSELYSFNKKGISVDVFNQYKLNSCELNSLKTTNRVLNVLASIYSKENFLDDVIILNDQNNIVEFTSGNIFLILNNQLITPPLKSGCINGIIRRKILSFKNFLDLEIIEKDVKKVDLFNAKELFFTNVIFGLKWVSNFREISYKESYSKLILKKINTLI